MNLAAFDLNLLLVFDSLMSERHVTRAGQRIGLSQPAVSAALNRLRAIFQDELFIRSGGEMVPTPRALTLAEPIGDALRRVEIAVNSTARFDPTTVHRSFVLLGADYVSFLVVPPLLAHLQTIAPGIALRVLDAQRGPIDKLLDEGFIDFAVETQSEYPQPLRSQFLLRERYVVVAAAGHPQIRAAKKRAAPQALDLEVYCRLPHVLHSISGGMTGNVDAALVAIGRRRHVALSLPHFFSIARAVASSQMIATYPERLARVLAPMLGLQIYEAPVELAPISLSMVWHRRNDTDAGHVWMRQQMMETASSLG